MKGPPLRRSQALAAAPDSPVGAPLREKREALIADLGGADQCSTAQLAIVDLIVAAWWQLESVTGYLLRRATTGDRRPW